MAKRLDAQEKDPTLLKRIQYHHYGDYEQMVLEEYTLPPPKAHELVINVKAASVNPIDYKIRAGTMKIITGNSFPRAMGMDFAGIVEAVGGEVTRFKIGDEVIGIAPVKSAGAFGKTVIAKEKAITHKPTNITFEQAACLPNVGVAAWTALITRAHLTKGQTVFVNGCLGSVGRTAVQIAMARGAVVSGSASTDSLDEARGIGLKSVLDYTHLDLLPLASSFDIVFDTSGKLTMQQAFQLLRHKGIFLDINPSTGKIVRGIFDRRYKVVFGSITPETLSQIADAAASGVVKPVIGKIVPLTDAIKAISELELGKSPRGKLVIIP